MCSTLVSQRSNMLLNIQTKLIVPSSSLLVTTLPWGRPKERLLAAGTLVSPHLCTELDIYTKCRGLAGTVLVYKLAGALANRGASLDEVHSIAQWVASRLGTIGVGLEHCHVSSLVVEPCQGVIWLGL